jgi:hypothetical protein
MEPWTVLLNAPPFSLLPPDLMEAFPVPGVTEFGTGEPTCEADRVGIACRTAVTVTRPLTACRRFSPDAVHLDGGSAESAGGPGYPPPRPWLDPVSNTGRCRTGRFDGRPDRSFVLDGTGGVSPNRFGLGAPTRRVLWLRPLGGRLPLAPDGAHGIGGRSGACFSG